MSALILKHDDEVKSPRVYHVRFGDIDRDCGGRDIATWCPSLADAFTWLAKQARQEHQERLQEGWLPAAMCFYQIEQFSSREVAELLRPGSGPREKYIPIVAMVAMLNALAVEVPDQRRMLNGMKW